MPEPITKCPVKKDIVLRQRRLPFHVILYNPRGPQVHYYPIPETKFHLVDKDVATSVIAYQITNDN
jgi:hypothetical protein